MKKESRKKENEDDNLPGYPHYPPEEDILNSAEEIPLDIENIARGANINTTISEAGKPSSTIKEKETIEDEIISKALDGPGEADVTDEDLQALGELGMSLDDGDDDVLKHRAYPNVAGDGELDIPGADLDDDMEDIGNEDEENNYYSLGGDKD